MQQAQQLSDKERELIRTQELEDIEKILKTPEGKRFFRRFAGDSFMFKSTATGNSWGQFNEGKRNLFLLYFGDIMETCPEVVEFLMPDNKKE